MFTGLRRNNKFVMAALFVWALGEGLWYINLRQLYLVELGATEVQVGTSLALEAVIRALLPIPAGYIGDRFGTHPVMVASWLLGIIGALAVGLAQTWQMAIPGLMIYAMSAFAIPAISAYVLQNVPDRAVPGVTDRALAAVYAVYPAGLVISPFVGGLLADRFSIRAAVHVSAIMFTLSTLIVLQSKPVPVESDHGTDHPRDLLRNRAFATLMAYIVVVLVAMYLGYQLLPNFLQDVHGFSYGQIGLLFSVAAAGGAVLNLVAGRLPPRFNFAVMLALFGLALFGVWQATALPIVALAFFAGGSLNVIRTLASVRAADVVSARNQGLAFGIIETLLSLAMVVASAAAGRLYAIGRALPLIVALAALLPLGLLWFVVWPTLPKRGRAEPATVPITKATVPILIEE